MKHPMAEVPAASKTDTDDKHLAPGPASPPAQPAANLRVRTDRERAALPKPRPGPRQDRELAGPHVGPQGAVERRPDRRNTGSQGRNPGLKAVVDDGGGPAGEFRRRMERLSELRAARGAGITAEEEAELIAAEEEERQKRRKVSDSARVEYLIRDAMAQEVLTT